MTVLQWEKRGRSFYASAGKLSLQVKIAPPRYLGEPRRWVVGEIFGHHWLADHTEYFADFAAAAERAEGVARATLIQASDALAGVVR